MQALIQAQIQPNIVSDKKDYYISYNPVDIAVYGDVTTAIVIGQMEKFYILNGNHYKELSDMKSLEKCMAYFYEHNDSINKKI